MRCSVCGEHIGGRGDRCPGNGLRWHNRVHKERYQRKHWGGPAKYWDWPTIYETPLLAKAMDLLFAEVRA